MASSSSALCEDQLLCCICLDVFTDPVSTSCGHNFCMICLKDYWDSSSHCQCPVCKEKFSNRPKLHVNTFISALAAPFKKSVQLKSSRAAEKPTRSQVLCEVCCEKQCVAVKSCLICMASYCKTHLEPHDRVSSLKKHKLMEPVENLEDYICQKHDRPLELFCRDDQTCVCQFCTEGDHKTHNTVSIEEESVKKKNELVKTQAEVQQKIQAQLKKIEEIKHSVEVNKINTEKEKADVVKMFSALMHCIERTQAGLLKVMEEKQKAAERQAKEIIKDLEQELSELKRRNTDLEQLLNTEDHLHLLQIYPSLCSSPHTQDWTSITMTSHLSVETLRKALSQVQETLSQEMEKIDETVDVTLDPDTAYPYLVLSDDGKQVTYGDKSHNLPDNPERFNRYCIVLGKEGFSSGRFYYEVQVKGKTEWDLGVARESINRKGEIRYRPEDRFWCVILRNKTGYTACDSPTVSLSFKQSPQKVGVFVDYEEGLVSFYDVDAKSHIYSFTAQTFTEKLYPYFCPCTNDGDLPVTVQLSTHPGLDFHHNDLSSECGDSEENSGSASGDSQPGNGED
ncbi:bloodthirsty-relatedprotein family, member 6 [Silurus asotus]|uniref:Bloodthirsty-relatedprotein family, member 6 n=1 Tax=Silurus asotus TaxID=30991 RepID=A0AAD5B2P5_SILAS|nr:bloodthirsty-relatedprotein family, member 6 [Silurus asotus]